MERACFTARHDFDFLPTTARVEVRPATFEEMPAVAAMARSMVPGVQIGEQGLLQHHLHDPECILVFARKGGLLGGMAFLYLNERGHDALMSGELSPTHPDFSLLAGANEQVAAIYIWAIGATGRGIAGLGKMAAHLRKPRYVDANCFAQPSTAAGRDLMIATGFRPIASSQPDLWCYERPWKRLPAGLGASNFTQGSISDARY
ncbi:hypothetical protein [Bradyrhizobium sp.]|uniref:hypothetical protein n=1 Tax=Bradyrhizobium sp. TaxID=376 RepID=UPI001DBFB335|nr:hypothetical protein [Bradyrhizobium sp.]MBI5319255.1 hypothetical protein [Bradyrhizobium sp.]